MNTKLTLTTLIAAAALSAGGFAVAQSSAPTSTPGNGCTATANAMKGGNMGSSPSAIACADGTTPTAAAATGTTSATPAAGATTTAADSSAMGNSGAKRAAPLRVAKADRN